MKNFRKVRIWCGSLGGRSNKTGKPVGKYHSWNGGNVCEWCGRSKSETLRIANPPTITL